MELQTLEGLSKYLQLHYYNKQIDTFFDMVAPDFDLQKRIFGTFPDNGFKHLVNYLTSFSLII